MNAEIKPLQIVAVEDAKKADPAGQGNPAARAFYACLNMNTCHMQVFSLEKARVIPQS